MQAIADWLEKLGMSEYTQRFAENEIDVSVLRRSHRSGPQRYGSCRLDIGERCLAAIAEHVGRRQSTARQPQLTDAEGPRTPPSDGRSRFCFLT